MLKNNRVRRSLRGNRRSSWKKKISSNRTRCSWNIIRYIQSEQKLLGIEKISHLVRKV